MTNEEQLFLDRYKKELKEGREYKPEEISGLYNVLSKGDESVINDLTEALMPRALEAVLEMDRGNIFVGDLVQEAGLAIFLALSEAAEKPKEKPYDEYIDEALDKALSSYIEENSATREAGERVADKLNIIAETMEQMEKDYGSAFGIDDVAEETGFAAEEIKELFKLAGEDLGE